MLYNDERTPILLTDQNFYSFTDSIKKDKLKFFQFYNIEIESSEFSFIKYMNTYKDNLKPKKLNKTYYDIETFVNENGDFTDPTKVIEEINAIALYNNITNVAYGLAYVHKSCNIESHEQVKNDALKIINDKVAENPIYHVDGIKYEILLFDSEKDMLKEFFKLVHSFNTLTLSGFNSHIFDDPYLFNRIAYLFGEEASKNIISEFGEIEKFGQGSYELPDFILVDILELYKPVGQGGGGLGKSLSSYKLNHVAFKELKIRKLDLPGGFRENYLNNLAGYIAYNIFDTLLTFKLDEKLQFLELTFDLAQYNHSTMGAAMSGRSILYSYRNDYTYVNQGKLVRSKKFSSEVVYEPNIPKNMM